MKENSIQGIEISAVREMGIRQGKGDGVVALLFYEKRTCPENGATVMNFTDTCAKRYYSAFIAAERRKIMKANLSFVLKEVNSSVCLACDQGRHAAALMPWIMDQTRKAPFKANRRRPKGGSLYTFHAGMELKQPQKSKKVKSKYHDIMDFCRG